MERMTQEEMAQAQAAALRVLVDHVGPSRKIGMGEFYRSVFGKDFAHRINDTKQLREVVTRLRREGVQVCSSTSSANGGYWLAASASELNDYCGRVQARALKALGRVAAMRKVALPEYLGQLQLELTQREDA